MKAGYLAPHHGNKHNDGCISARSAVSGASSARGFVECMTPRNKNSAPVEVQTTGGINNKPKLNQQRTGSVATIY